MLQPEDKSVPAAWPKSSVSDQSLYRDFTVLNQMGQEITASRELAHIFQTLFRHLTGLVQIDVFRVDLYHSSSQEIERAFHIEYNQAKTSTSVRIDDRGSLSAWCIRHQLEVFMADALEELGIYLPDFHGQNHQSVASGRDPMRSVMYFPLIMDGTIIGAISTQSHLPGAYTEYHRLILKTLASYAAVAISNAQAYEQLSQAMAEIEHKQRSITDSLQYARRIQEAIFPNISDIYSVLPNSFVYYKPRDIVSGDFYWFSHREDLVVLAVVDCTGHGVPGAFMSILGYSQMNQIINEKAIYRPRDILSKLDQAVRTTLKQMSPNSIITDGMDVALCVIETRQRRLHFSSANRPLFYVKGDEIIVEKGNVRPIGGWKIDAGFQEVTYDYKPGFTFYLSSDGFTDQFGGRDRRKFLNKRLSELFGRINHLPMTVQQSLIDEAFNNWKGDNPQIDDVLVIGVKLD
jgi:serine phosphatase RsbU (regulator of sigma subunit)